MSMPNPLRVNVIGAGVIGLSIACELLDRGATVTVISDAAHPYDCSPLAGAVWFPYGVSLDPEVLAWSWVTRERLEYVAHHDPAAGVAIRDGRYIIRDDSTDVSWAVGLPSYRELDLAELPDGALRGFTAALPVVDMSRYLPWLRNRAGSAHFVNRHITTLSDTECFHPDAVVVAAGIRSAELIADEAPPKPVRGQVVRLRNPGLTDWYVDELAPDGMTYVIPRFDDVVCGGTALAGDWSTEIDTATEAAILRRAIARVPALAGQPVVSRGVGLRPTRPSVRCGWVDGQRLPTLACYGHGGAGVSLSWGSAEAVARALAAR